MEGVLARPSTTSSSGRPGRGGTYDYGSADSCPAGGGAAARTRLNHSQSSASSLPAAEQAHNGGGRERQRFGFFSLLIIAYFFVCGGVFGNEAMVEAASPVYIYSTMIAVLLVYGMPLAVVSTELAAALPLDGGPVAWVDEAFGLQIGFQNCYWQMISHIIDCAVYPCLAAEYLVADAGARLGGDSSEDKSVSFFAMMIIVAVTLIKLAGTDIFVRFSTLLAAVSLAPILIFVFYGMSVLNNDAVASTSGAQTTDWSLLLSWSMWLNVNFLTIGTLAAETQNIASTLPRVVAVLAPVLTFMNVMPLAVSLSLDPVGEHYEAGYFSDLARQLLGRWLSVCFIVAANVNNIGLYSSLIMVCERSLLRFVQAQCPAFCRRMDIRAQTAGPVFRYLWIENGQGVAPLYIISVAVVCLTMVWLPYYMLVEIGILIVGPSCILILAAFVHLKWTRPFLARPFNFPGRVLGALALTGPAVGLTCALMYFSLSDSKEIFGISYFKLISFVVVNGFGVALHVAFLWYTRRYPAADPDELTSLIPTEDDGDNAFIGGTGGAGGYGTGGNDGSDQDRSRRNGGGGGGGGVRGGKVADTHSSDAALPSLSPLRNERDAHITLSPAEEGDDESMVKKDVPATNFALHEARCLRVQLEQSRRPTAAVSQPDAPAHAEASLTTYTTAPIATCAAAPTPVSRASLSQPHVAADELIRCPYCELPLLVADVVSHTEMCGARTEPCLRCNRRVLLKDWLAHTQAPTCPPPPPPWQRHQQQLQQKDALTRSSARGSSGSVGGPGATAGSCSAQAKRLDWLRDELVAGIGYDQQHRGRGGSGSSSSSSNTSSISTTNSSNEGTYALPPLWPTTSTPALGLLPSSSDHEWHPLHSTVGTHAPLPPDDLAARLSARPGTSLACLASARAKESSLPSSSTSPCAVAALKAAGVHIPSATPAPVTNPAAAAVSTTSSAPVPELRCRFCNASYPSLLLPMHMDICDARQGKGGNAAATATATARLGLLSKGAGDARIHRVGSGSVRPGDDRSSRGSRSSSSNSSSSSSSIHSAKTGSLLGSAATGRAPSAQTLSGSSTGRSQSAAGSDDRDRDGDDDTFPCQHCLVLVPRVRLPLHESVCRQVAGVTTLPGAQRGPRPSTAVSSAAYISAGARLSAAATSSTSAALTNSSAPATASDRPSTATAVVQAGPSTSELAQRLLDQRTVRQYSLEELEAIREGHTSSGKKSLFQPIDFTALPIPVTSSGAACVDDELPPHRRDNIAKSNSNDGKLPMNSDSRSSNSNSNGNSNSTQAAQAMASLSLSRAKQSCPSQPLKSQEFLVTGSKGSNNNNSTTKGERGSDAKKPLAPTAASAGASHGPRLSQQLPRHGRPCLVPLTANVTSLSGMPATVVASAASKAGQRSVLGTVVQPPLQLAGSSTAARRSTDDVTSNLSQLKSPTSSSSSTVKTARSSGDFARAKKTSSSGSSSGGGSGDRARPPTTAGRGSSSAGNGGTNGSQIASLRIGRP